MTDLIEEWRPIAGYEGRYDVSSLGRVRSWTRPNGRGPCIRLDEPAQITLKKFGKRGQYRKVTLSLRGKKTTVLVHALVTSAFHGPRPGNFEVAHGDGDGVNNQPGNVRWASHAANMDENRQRGVMPRGETHRNAKLTERQVREIRAAGGSPTALAKQYGISQGAMRCVLDRRTWRHV